VRVVFSREDVVRLGPKRPPIAAGLHADGTGLVRVVASPGVTAAIRQASNALEVDEVAGVTGPAVSGDIRAAGWAEAAVLLAATGAVAAGRVPVGNGAAAAQAAVTTPEGGRADASVTVDAGGWPAAVDVEVSAGDPLDETVLLSYVTGGVHMALGWVLSEGIAIDEDGEPEDLTIRSFGVLRARDTPPITVRFRDRSGPPVRISDAVFAAVAAATWIAQGLPPRFPTRRGRTS
jgi:hypothetical protein